MFGISLGEYAKLKQKDGKQGKAREVRREGEGTED
jgi:hypothetical protein